MATEINIDPEFEDENEFRKRLEDQMKGDQSGSAPNEYITSGEPEIENDLPGSPNAVPFQTAKPGDKSGEQQAKDIEQKERKRYRREQQERLADFQRQQTEQRRAQQQAKKDEVAASREIVRDIRSQAISQRVESYSLAAAVGLPGYITASVVDSLYIRPNEDKRVKQEQDYQAELARYYEQVRKDAEAQAAAERAAIKNAPMQATVFDDQGKPIPHTPANPSTQQPSAATTSPLPVPPTPTPTPIPVQPPRYDKNNIRILEQPKSVKAPSELPVTAVSSSTQQPPVSTPTPPVPTPTPGGQAPVPTPQPPIPPSPPAPPVPPPTPTPQPPVPPVPPRPPGPPGPPAPTPTPPNQPPPIPPTPPGRPPVSGPNISPAIVITAAVEAAQAINGAVDKAGQAVSQTGQDVVNGNYGSGVKNLVKGAQTAFDPLGVNIPVNVAVQGFNALIDINQSILDATRENLGFAPQSLEADVNADISRLLQQISISQRTDATTAELIRANRQLEEAWAEVKVKIINEYGPVIIGLLKVLTEIVGPIGTLLSNPAAISAIFGPAAGLVIRLLQAIAQNTAKAEVDQLNNNIFDQLERFFNPKTKVSVN